MNDPLNSRSPAFRWYPADFMADINVQLMDWTQRGIYIWLIGICWLEKTIPADLGSLAKLTHVSVGWWEENGGQILKCFKPAKEGRLMHPRIEKEREKQQIYHDRKRLSGEMGAKVRWSKLSSIKNNNRSAIRLPIANDSYSFSSSLSLSKKDLPPNPLSGGNSSHPLFEIFKEKNQKMPSCIKLTKDRLKQCKNRCKDPEFQEAFTKAVVKTQTCDFLTGGNDRHWKADFDWLIKNDRNVYKILEGKYVGLFDENIEEESTCCDPEAISEAIAKMKIRDI